MIRPHKGFGQTIAKELSCPAKTAVKGKLHKEIIAGESAEPVGKTTRPKEQTDRATHTRAQKRFTTEIKSVVRSGNRCEKT